MTKAEKKETLAAIVAALEELYPAAECALEYGGEPWKLLVMARLSAQCTDARVNLVCRDLFAQFPSAEALADAPVSKIEALVRPCGLYHTKAESIKAACAMLVNDFGGVLPSDMDTLLRFPGVGRKIANLLRGDVFHLPAVVTDTHCIRVCGRFGIYPQSLRDPRRVETILEGLLEPDKQSDFCHRVILLGREYCRARSPRCGDCPLRALCAEAASRQTKG